MDKKLLVAIEEAVKAYRAVVLRGNKYVVKGYTAKKLVKEFPKYYTLHTNGRAHFIGRTAGEILEEYLKELGYEPGSIRWSRLMTAVVILAKDGIEE
tara:strand:- start:36 stop:326 length:291 start_codon:yes stop_codon:yes gene_type:complete